MPMVPPGPRTHKAGGWGGEAMTESEWSALGEVRKVTGAFP